MSKLIPLSPSLHQTKCIDVIRAISEFREAQVIRLRVSEVGNSACCFPVLFTKDSTNGLWDVSALTALEPHSNLFVDQGSWKGVYSPLSVRTHPVRLQKLDDREEINLALAPEHLSESGKRLYDDKGRPTDYLSTVEQALYEDLKSASATQVFCQELQALGLIKPINIKVQYQDGTNRILEGLYTLDQDKLSALDNSTQIDLQQRGYLMAAHSMLVSLFQLNRLIQMHNDLVSTKPITKILLQSR